jgi:hypothetical protein
VRGFELDRSFDRELMHSAYVHDLLEEKVDAVAEVARDLAPDDPSTAGLDLHTDIEGEVGLTDAGWQGRVNAFDFKAGWYEKGASGVTARPFLRPALEQEVGPLEAAPAGREGE